MRKFKRIWGKPWDYSYLLKLEQYKIREMCKYIQKSQLTEDWKLQVRDLKICDKLISIINEEDKYHVSWIKNTNNKFPTHVNSNNFRRFIKTLPLTKVKDSPHIHCSLRIHKALYLYNLIRSYKLLGWWS